ncbi:MAG: peptidase T, partial [Acholeplasmataceae bacterium]
KIDTQSNPNSKTFPSTDKQKNLSRQLVFELKEMGIKATLDDYGYVYAKIAGNVDTAPAIGFIAHVDTSFDAPGYPVNPRIIKNYQGEKIVLNQDLSMEPSSFLSLNRVIGQDIIVTDGNTLLGADNKCGVAEIMELAAYFMENPDEPHGDVYICFTPDEEIGRGTDYFNHDWFKADFAYTADGGEVGGIEYENFNAASASVKCIGKSIHPGSAKNKLVNAQHLGIEFHRMLPRFLDPANTEGYEGFNHLSSFNGSVEEASLHYIIRNHSKELFKKQKETFVRIKDYLNDLYGYNAIEVEIKDSYYNMYEVLKDHMHIIDLAEKAIKSVGVVPYTDPIRGGTDGARLTFEGLLCPNLGTGAYQFHGRFEFASIQQMEKAVEILIAIVKIAAQKK